jgi:hypothetical protein
MYEGIEFTVSYTKQRIEITGFLSPLQPVYYRGFNHKLVNGKLRYKPLPVVMRYWKFAINKKQKGWLKWEKEQIYKKRLLELLSGLPQKRRRSDVSSSKTDESFPQDTTEYLP